MTLDDTITVVTPTFNRGYTLKKCYESLRKQTAENFVWMIIDDGSTDNTEELVGNLIKKESFKIYYHKKENGGKASALNMALDKVKTEYFVCLDSDDIFADNAIETAIVELSKVKSNDSYAGIMALRNMPGGEPVGGKEIPKGINDITLIELDCVFKINSELIVFYKTEVINKFRFPEITGEKFISPAYIEHAVGKEYKFVASRQTYCYCEYLPDGLTKNKIEVIKKNPQGYTMVKKQSYELAGGFVPKSKHAIMYIAGSILSNDHMFIKKSPNIMMTILLYPLGWLAYLLKFK